MKTYQVLRV